MRLAKYLARAGVASRRKAETIIAAGRVKVNGVTVNVPQTLVTEDDRVSVDDNPVHGTEKNIYILLNKPPGYISTACDTHGRPTVIDLLTGVGRRVYPVGRLDADTRGVLLLTSDGTLTYRLTHPRYQVEKVYHVRVEGSPVEKSLQKLRSGILIEGKKTAPAGIRVIEGAPGRSSTLLEVRLREGRKRQVKKMLAAVNHPVTDLCRFSFAGLKAGNMAEGKWRYLDEEEINMLYRMVGI